MLRLEASSRAAGGGLALGRHRARRRPDGGAARDGTAPGPHGGLEIRTAKGATGSRWGSHRGVQRPRGQPRRARMAPEEAVAGGSKDPVMAPPVTVLRDGASRSPSERSPRGPSQHRKGEAGACGSAGTEKGKGPGTSLECRAPRELVRQDTAATGWPAVHGAVWRPPRSGGSRRCSCPVAPRGRRRSGHGRHTPGNECSRRCGPTGLAFSCAAGADRPRHAAEATTPEWYHVSVRRRPRCQLQGLVGRHPSTTRRAV